jgi:predicted RNase H-like nuclease
MADTPVAMTIVGFDSAWTDNPKSPGAVSVIRTVGDHVEFVEPILASFSTARQLIDIERAKSRFCLIAIDQPTVVPNATGMRPVDRLASSFVSWLGGGVQPANRSRKDMFGEHAPIWRFTEAIGAVEDPELCRTELEGSFIVEVFPALALAGMEQAFCDRLCAPRYNPARRRTFRMSAWQAVLAAVSTFGAYLGVDVGEWCDRHRQLEKPRKSDQDQLDAIICALVGLHWLRSPRRESMMLGDLLNGYMIAPVLSGVHERIRSKAKRFRIPIDGSIPG